MNARAPVKPYRYLDIIAAFFSVGLIVSNIASGAKIIDTGLSFFGTAIAFDGGTLLFPVSYIFGDILAEVYGFKTTRKVIWTGFAALVFSSAFFFLLKELPGEQEWREYAGEAAYTAILGGISSGGIVLASLAGYLAGELSNAASLVRIKALTRGRFLFVRTIGSSLVGEFLDSLVFVSICCAAGVFPRSLFTVLLLSNYILKCALEIILTPVTCAVCAALKRAEAPRPEDGARPIVHNGE